MVEVRQEKLQRAYSKIVDDGKDLHISGQPGIGKSEFLTNLHSRLSDDYNIKEQSVCKHHSPEDLESDLLHLARSAAAQRDLRPNQITSLSAGVLSLFNAGATKDDREEDRHKLKDLTSNWSGTPLVIFVDDIHKIADEEETVRDVINDSSTLLGDNVHLVTAGQISISKQNDVEEIHLNLYTHDQTRIFLEEMYGDITDDRIQEIHSAVEGHPLYLRLLSESADNLDDILFPPDDEVYTTIEERYIESLPPETEQFLRQVAPLPELDEKTCYGITDDFSITEIDRILRTLSQRVIVQQVNRTDDGHNIYKIHELFREFLAQKHQNEEQVHRKAFQYHLEEIGDKVLSGGKEAWANSLPHSFYAHYHLGMIYGGIKPNHFVTELDQMDLAYPVRGIAVIYTSIAILPKDAPDIWKLEFPTFSDWIHNSIDQEPIAELIHQMVECFLSQFDDNPKQLEDIQVEASLDDLPIESHPVNELDISEQHADQFRKSLRYMFKFFLADEPYRKKTHREHATKLFDMYGISMDVVFAFKNRMKALLSDSDIGDEFDEVTEQYSETLGQELENSLTSSLDFYKVSNQALDLGTDVLENFHYQALLSSGLLEEVVIEGGDVWEDAENPAFAMVWYAVFTAYFRQTEMNSEIFTEVKSRYIEQLEQRQEYEEQLESPMLNSAETAEKLDIEETEV